MYYLEAWSLEVPTNTCVTSNTIFDYTFLRRPDRADFRHTTWNGQGRTFLTWGVTYLAPFFFQKLSVVIYIHMYNRVNLKLFVYALNFFCPTKIFPRTHSSSLKSCCLVVCSTIVCSLGKVKKKSIYKGGDMSVGKIQRFWRLPENKLLNQITSESRNVFYSNYSIF